MNKFFSPKMNKFFSPKMNKFFSPKMNKFFSPKIALLVILLIHLFLLSKLTLFPYPELFVYPYLTNHGLAPYSQILDQHFPGLMFLAINFNNLGMTTPAVARFWLMGTVVLTHLLIFLISKELLKSGKKALLVNGLYFFWQPFFEGWVLWIDSFLPPILLGSFYLLLKFLNLKKLKYLFLAGLVLGVGIVIKQVVIPLAGLLLLYLIWDSKSLKVAAYYLLGVLIPVALTLIYLISINVLHDFIYWTITFNLTIFAEFGRKAAEFNSLVRVGFVLAMSTFVIFWKDKRLVQLLALFIIGSLVAIYARFDLIHFQPTLPFVLLASTLGLFSIWPRLAGKLVILGYIVVAIWWLMIFYRANLSGRVLFFDAQIMDIAARIEKKTYPGEKIFIFGAPLHLYQITQTLPPGDVFVFQFPWFMMIAESRVLEGIKKDKPNIVVIDRSVKIQGAKITDFASKIDHYIEENYQPIENVGQIRIMRKKDQ